MQATESKRLSLGHALALAAASLLALTATLLEYGFVEWEPTGTVRHVSPLPITWIHAGEFVAAILFALTRWSQMSLSPARRVHLREHALELILALAAMGTTVIVAIRPASITEYQQFILLKAIQAYLLLQLISVFAQLSTLFVRSVLHPFRGIVTGFVVLILIGALLLCLPSASYRQQYSHWGNNFVDHLFTATSAACVTGLVVRDTATDYTPFGKLVIMILIQLGGLGIVIFGTIFAVLIGRQVTLREATLVQDLYSEHGIGQIRRIVIFVIVSTFLIESVGAALMYGMWNEPGLTESQRVFKSIFHAISAYCNTGFALQSDNLVAYAGRWQIYLVLMPLIVLGGLGFPVLLNIARVATRRSAGFLGFGQPEQDFERHRPIKLGLQSKIVLSSSVVLILVGAAVIFMIERPTDQKRWGRNVEYEDVKIRNVEHVLRNENAAQRILDSLFQSVSARTAGFNTVATDRGSLQPGTLMVLMALMFIGGSPASTAGGVKTVTVVLLLAAALATLRRRPLVEMFRRTIDLSLIRRAMTLAVLYFMLVWTVGLLLVLTNPQQHYLELLFEATSACGTVGYSTGVTPLLNAAGKICLIFGMFAGRVGPLTLLFSLTRTGKTVRYEYPREALVIG